jgi:hypothetical protein
MTDSDDPPDNVIPFRHVIPIAIVRGLREYYASLLSEPMPQDIAALCREFEKRTQKAEESEEETDAGVG